jgi:pyridoxine 4-dehydrogenase
VKQVEDMAAKKGKTPGQIALGWVIAHSEKKGLPQILPIPGATTTERITENMEPAQLSEDDMAALADILKRFPVKGERYMAEAMHHLEA